MAARLWTNGFDFFCPRRNYCFHLWERIYRPTFFDAKNASTQAASLNRVRELLAGKEDPFGVGKQRSLSDFWKMCGVDLNNRTYTTPGVGLPESAFYTNTFDSVMALLNKRN